MIDQDVKNNQGTKMLTTRQLLESLRSSGFPLLCEEGNKGKVKANSLLLLLTLIAPPEREREWAKYFPLRYLALVALARSWWIYMLIFELQLYLLSSWFGIFFLSFFSPPLPDFLNIILSKCVFVVSRKHTPIIVFPFLFPLKIFSSLQKTFSFLVALY